jgi:DNA-binding transcriptional LysR family regulator
MNIHHLELFYYVAKSGGISEAARKIPYGIQQPAISAQVGQLEQNLGVSLFQRRPFALTPAGQELFQFIQPFFENVGKMADRIRGGILHHIRIGASEIVLREHLPAIMRRVREQFPKVRVTLRDGYQAQLESWLRANDLDMTVTLLEHKAPPALHAATLIEIPLVLLVHKSSPIRSAAELLARDPIGETLISLPANEAVAKAFQEGLRQRKLDWPAGMEVSSLALVESYVENNYGIGLSVLPPRRKMSSQLRVLPLEGFPPVTLGVLWTGSLSPVAECFLEVIKAHALDLAKGAAGSEAISAEIPGTKRTKAKPPA